MCRQLLLFLLLTLWALAYGVDQRSSRIIGGYAVDIARHPYMVSLRYRREERQELGYLHECAGVIYSQRAVITCAQCLWDLPENTKVMAVAGARTRNGTDGMVYPVSEWSYHEKFDYYTVDYDIGVLILDAPLDFGHYEIASIGLRPLRPAVNRTATVAGWGYVEEWGPSSHQLEQADVPIVSQEQCKSIYGEDSVTERMVCAGDVEKGGRDACQGDTGGPLVIDSQLVGLVSWGRGCAREGYPTVYTFVASLKEWIDDKLEASNAL